jgi:hypothetical protein
VDVDSGLGNTIAVDVDVGTARVTVGVGDSSPVTGIPGSTVGVSPARVCAIAVFMIFGSGVGCPGAQAWAINNIEPSNRIRIVFGICPPFQQRLSLPLYNQGLFICLLFFCRMAFNYKNRFCQ